MDEQNKPADTSPNVAPTAEPTPSTPVASTDDQTWADKTSSVPVPPSAAPPTTDSSAGTTNKTTMWLVIILVILLAVGAGVYLMRHKSPAKKTSSASSITAIAATKL